MRFTMRFPTRSATVTAATFLAIVYFPASKAGIVVTGSKAATTPPLRPALVQAALANDEDIYYFGLGSNMLKSKLENRSADGSPIEILSMEPAVVPNYRLAFNMRGFLPLEPGMGSLEPVDDTAGSCNSRPLVAYKANECHGALIRVSATNYEKIMRSEGVTGRPDQGYEEVVVNARPYNNSHTVVPAVALRARPHARLSRDPAPSLRYLKILRQGAQELCLEADYQSFLESHPVATVALLTRRVALCNLIATSTLSFRFKFRLPSKIQKFLLWRCYVPPTANRLLRLGSEIITIAILLPGSFFGACFLLYQKLTKKEMSKMMQSMVDSHW